MGIYVGVTEHGNVETENEIYLLKGYDYDTQYWSHHHNPRTVANNPAGEISLNLGITGPHYTLGAACAAGNAGIIQGVQMLRLGDCDVALAGGVSESIHTFGIFASFHSQGALARHADPTKASRPFDADRNGIVVAEGGCMFVLERLADAKARGAKIYGEVAGYAMNSDAHDFVLPHPERQAECMRLALRRAGLEAADIDIVSTHATGTTSGDVQEAEALRQVFCATAAAARCSTTPRASSATPWGPPGPWNWPAICPPSTTASAMPRSTSTASTECDLPGLVANQPREMGRVRTILNNSFGMLGINSVVIVRRVCMSNASGESCHDGCRNQRSGHLRHPLPTSRPTKT